jgi:hypothetical protein
VGRTSTAGEFDESHTADANGEALRQQPWGRRRESREDPSVVGVNDWWPVDLLQGVDDGMAHRVDRVTATGNGQVPGVVALAWRTLNG